MAPGISLAQGLAALGAFTNELEGLGRTSMALGNAERLFGLSVTPYPDLQAAQDALRTCRPIYDLFVELQASLQAWSSLLWVDLDLDTIDKGSERWIARLADFNPDLQALSAFRSGAPRQ